MRNNKHEKKDSERNERIDHPDFARFDYPFGLPQGVFNAIFVIGITHLFLLYCLYAIVTNQIAWSALIFQFIVGYSGGLGNTIGCHRYWAHKTFKATLPLQIILMILQTIALQYPIRKWCLDHRIHHKYTDTNADPHNSKRGFWFSHVGWLILPKHPDFQKKLKFFRVDDLDNDPIVRFQSRWYWTLVAIFHFAIPMFISHYFFGLTFWQCVAVNHLRYSASLHFTWSVNSFAHMWGDKPYDKNISPVDNKFVSLVAVGEGWHNYHHTFPWDYKAAEFGWKINVSTMLIDFFAWLGWAYDLKTVPEEMLQNRYNRTGDGSHANHRK